MFTTNYTPADLHVIGEAIKIDHEDGSASFFIVNEKGHLAPVDYEKWIKVARERGHVKDDPSEGPVESVETTEKDVKGKKNTRKGG
jgi:hypothetical protein